jgi:membrane associated rhomboid family serine protease
MGIYDRDYIRDRPRGGFGTFALWSVTTWLLVVTVAVSITDGFIRRMSAPPIDPMLPEFEEAREAWVEPAPPGQPHPWMGPLVRWGYLSTEKAIYRGQVWRFLTFPFVHGWPGHLIINMLGLFLFGPLVEAHFGGRRFFAFYVLCALAGAGAYLLLSTGRVLVPGADTPLDGASASVLGLLVAAAMIAPDVEVVYYILPVTIRALAWLAIAVAAYTLLATGYNAGAQAAHLAGGALGFLLMRNQHWLNPFAPSRRAEAVRPSVRRRGGRPFQKDWSKDFDR